MTKLNLVVENQEFNNERQSNGELILIANKRVKDLKFDKAGNLLSGKILADKWRDLSLNEISLLSNEITAFKAIESVQAKKR